MNEVSLPSLPPSLSLLFLYQIYIQYDVFFRAGMVWEEREEELHR